MTDFTALEAALAAWQDSRNEDDRVKAQQAFESLPLGHQNLILDDATVGRLEGGDLLECIWQSWHGDEATTWLKELQQCRLTMSDTESLGIGIYDDLEQLAHSVLSDPQSCHYGSRLWVQEGNVLGAQQGVAVLAANLKAYFTDPVLVDQQLSSMPNIDFSQARVLIVGQQQLPKQLSSGQLLLLRYLDLTDHTLSALPESFGSLTSLRVLRLYGCKQLTTLPPSFGELAELQVLNLRRCVRLAVLPDSFGQLLKLERLTLDWCTSLAVLPETLSQLAALQVVSFCGCWSLVQPLPNCNWTPQRQIRYVLALQRRQPAILKLATQQETMLTTLERMSWLAVLLATATFIAFMQPPGGLADEQVLVSDMSACSWHGVPAGDGPADDAADRKCALLVFFIMDGLSFGFSMGCVMMIIVLSMPRLKYEDGRLEAGRFWLLLLATWVLLYLAVLTGFAAFIASGLAVMNTWRVVVGPVIPGMLLLVVGFIAIVTRFHSLHPGAAAIRAALSPWSSRVYAKDEDADIEMGQSLFWKHWKQVLEPKQQQQQQQQQQEARAAAGQGSSADEMTRWLAPQQPGASSSGGPSQP